MSVKRDRLLCTIYTDASWKEINGRVVSSWAMYAKCKDVKLEFSEAFEDNTMVDPTHAEAEGTFRAIKKAIEKWNDAGVVFVNTDSLAVCHNMWPDGFGRRTFKFKKKGKAWEVVEAMKEWCDTHNVIHRFKHVKAHQGGKNIRSWVNERCDAKAKKERIKVENNK